MKSLSLFLDTLIACCDTHTNQQRSSIQELSEDFVPVTLTIVEYSRYFVTKLNACSGDEHTLCIDLFSKCVLATEACYGCLGDLKPSPNMIDKLISEQALIR